MPTVGWRRVVVAASMAILVGACSGSAATSSPEVSAMPVVRSPSPVASDALSPFPSPSPVASPLPSTVASPSPNPAEAAPAEPSTTRFVLVQETVAKDGFTTTERYRATWSEPDGAATRFLVYGVTECLRSLQENDNTPCVIAGTALPGSKLKLIGTAAGTARTIDVTWTLNSEAGPGPYQAVVLVAKNGHGSSNPVVLWSALVCYGCVI